MTTATTRPRCARCGALPEALIHVGDHPERCHRFQPAVESKPEPEQPPTFGMVQIEPIVVGFTDDSLERPIFSGFGGCLGQHSDDDTLDDMTPEMLRQLAADALAAAEWLEAQR